MSRWLITGAAVLLVATAAVHGRGFSAVSSAVLASGLDPSLIAAIRALWLMFSVQLVLLAVVVVLARGVPGARRVVLACALIPAVEAAVLLRFAGWFVGTYGLAAATLLLILGSLLWTKREGFREGA